MAVGFCDGAHGVSVHLLRHTTVVRAFSEQSGDTGEVFPEVFRAVSVPADQVQRRKMAGADAAVTRGEHMPERQAVRGHIDDAVFVVFQKHNLLQYKCFLLFPRRRRGNNIMIFYSFRPQHSLYFRRRLPSAFILPQGQGSFRPGFGAFLTGVFFTGSPPTLAAAFFATALRSMGC